MPQKKELTEEISINCTNAFGDFLSRHHIGLKYPFSNRFFRIIKEENGQVVNESLASHDSVASKENQNAFFQSILDGNAYFYPMDSRQPVRLSLKATPGRDSGFIFEESPVDLKPPKKPGFFKQIFHKLFGAFKEDFTNYDKAVLMQDY